MIQAPGFIKQVRFYLKLVFFKVQPFKCEVGMKKQIGLLQPGHITSCKK